ncbi:MAG TPA: LLM class flavin-dependent oxidoreductase [Ktedonosporobacter sp.]|jgi:alkanesulfonate monooxygenase SsuD/methylene tetrahydromethanopterin reductase-like flavin-dependent oxidoreductase (luciferase family)|nr:LLM class flavin-dependent oxidoreductase [Ktedonosporobacter sp.]
MSNIEFGLMLRLNSPGYSMSDVYEYNRRCIEALASGITTLWLEDHLQWGSTDVLEAFSTLSYLAALYPQYKVGTLVLAQSYRNPALLAKMAANVQFLSRGRMILGIGAGWKEDEYVSYGYPFPPTKIRMEQLEEAVQIIRAMWSSSPATFEGQHYQIRDAYCMPQPSPQIPILIGGGGEQRTLAIVARYADWWNFNSVTVEEYARKLAILRQHCERVGRDPATIKLTYLGTASISEDPAKVKRHSQKHFIAGTPAEVTSEIKRFQKIGITHFMFRIPDRTSAELLGQRVAPHFK